MARRFIGLGFEAIVACVDSTLLDGTFVGWGFDGCFLLGRPSIVDPCGRNGEFHSFVYNDPTFRWTVPSTVGGIVLRKGWFYYRDLMPVQVDIRGEKEGIGDPVDGFLTVTYCLYPNHPRV